MQLRDKEKFVKLIRSIRAPIVRFLKPASRYVLLERSPSLEPLSVKYGYDRGTPIDRFYIEKFLENNKYLIKGRCLEIQSDKYTSRFGENRITQRDIIDLHQDNKNATVHANIENMPEVPNNIFDTIILTQTLGMVPDFHSAIRECRRILKPGGTLLFTSKAMGPVYDAEGGYWKFTAKGAEYVFRKYFGKQVRVFSYGNVLSGQAFWVGMAQEDLTEEQLEYNDPRYPITIAAVAIKGLLPNTLS